MDPERVIYPLLKYVVMGPAMRVAFLPRVSGLGHVPRIGPVILAANHLGFLDSFVLPLMVPRRVHFLGKHEYFTGAGMKGRATATFFHSVGAIAVDRSGGRAALDALDTSAAVLERGGVFAIHPEGTRSPDGRLYRGRTGVARLAMRTGAPVVPVAIEGTDKVQPRGQAVPGPAGSGCASARRWTSGDGTRGSRAARPPARSPTRSWRPSSGCRARSTWTTTRPGRTGRADRGASATWQRPSPGLSVTERARSRGRTEIAWKSAWTSSSRGTPRASRRRGGSWTRRSRRWAWRTRSATTSRSCSPRRAPT
ncbi:lysophospholipid acyltransferase family protein [Actinomadura madurae]|uniref:lysophospholipid acyltransferase family protein n=1 Tax=Actinomadura madurae TaxID=1993 RepID=UPI0027E338CC|nr:lysophospholipid acyltransferase family protein [Actinomadura madurae]